MKYQMKLFCLSLAGLAILACSSVPNGSGPNEFENTSFSPDSIDEDNLIPPEFVGEGLQFTLLDVGALDNILADQFSLPEASQARILLEENAALFPWGGRSIIGTKELVSIMALACAETDVGIFLEADRQEMFQALLSREPTVFEELKIEEALLDVEDANRNFFECVLVGALPETTSLIQ